MSDHEPTAQFKTVPERLALGCIATAGKSIKRYLTETLALHACNIWRKELTLNSAQHTTGISTSFWSFAFFQEKSGRLLYLSQKCGGEKKKKWRSLTIMVRTVIFLNWVLSHIWKAGRNTEPRVTFYSGQNQPKVNIMDGRQGCGMLSKASAQ